MEPVKKSEAPDYYEIIRFPIGQLPTFVHENRRFDFMVDLFRSSSSANCLDIFVSLLCVCVSVHFFFVVQGICHVGKVSLAA